MKKKTKTNTLNKQTNKQTLNISFIFIGICCLKDDNDSRYHLLKEYRQNFQEVTALKILDKL